MLLWIIARFHIPILKCHYDGNRIFSIEAILKHKQEAPIRGGGGLNIPYPCNFWTKYPVSLKFRLQISRKLKAIGMLLATMYFNIRSLALKRKVEKYRFQVAFCDSCLNCCHSKYYGRYQVES